MIAGTLGSCGQKGSGQVGTASPERVVVTLAPAKSRTNVAAVRKRDHPQRAPLVRGWSSCFIRLQVCVTAPRGRGTSVVRRRRRGGRSEFLVLRQPVLGDLGRRVLVRAAVDVRDVAGEVAVDAGGRRRRPLERV